MDPVTSVKAFTVEKLSFRFGKDIFGGWMNVFLHDMGPRVGELIIHSDWGCWGYVWGAMGEGEDLKKFIVTADCDYITRKLTGGQDLEEWDPEATKKAVMEHIAENCPAHGYVLPYRSHPTTVLKEALYEELERCDFDCGPLLWLERMRSNLCEFLDQPSEFIKNRPSRTYRMLHDVLLPALKAHLAGGIAT